MMERLEIVMPVYNEAGRVGAVLASWCAVCSRLRGADWSIHAYDDGSTDGTLDVLVKSAKDTGGRLVVHTQGNQGHGPTILKGYREALARGADWVFQTDSDGEMSPESLLNLWEHRDEADFLAAIRSGRRQSLGRKIISAFSRLTVRVCFGRFISDVNVPYRLMRASALSPLLAGVPKDAFAPNVLICGFAARRGLRAWEMPVQHMAQRGSTAKLRLVLGAARALFETIALGAGHFLLVLLALAGILWGLAFAFSPTGSQSSAFCEKGRVFFDDFTRMVHVAQVGPQVEDVEARDVCYPALAYVAAEVIPQSTLGGAAFTGIGWMLFLGALAALVCAQMEKRCLLPALLAFGVCSPMLYAIEWGNPIIYAAAGVMLWMAWRDDASPTRRTCAAAALGLAAALKVAPAVFALDYLVRRKKDWKGLGWFVGFSMGLFLVPWFFWGGWEGLLAWFSNAAANARHYVHKGAWGGVPIGRTIRVLLGMNVSEPWTGIGWERATSVVVGLVALLGFGRGCSSYLRLMGLVTALLLIPGNMHFYTGIYLVPVCILWGQVLDGACVWLRLVEAACWFVIFCPVQFPMGVGSLNHPLANLAFLALVGLAMVRSFRLKVEG